MLKRVFDQVRLIFSSVGRNGKADCKKLKTSALVYLPLSMADSLRLQPRRRKKQSLSSRGRDGTGSFLGCGASPTDHVGNFCTKTISVIYQKRSDGFGTPSDKIKKKKSYLGPASQLVRPLIYEQDHYIRLSKKGNSI